MPQSIYSIYADKYKKQTSAEALFFHSSLLKYVKGLRVLLPEQGIEFTDNSYIGTDPAGFFYYNDIDTAKTANRYTSNNTTNPSDGQLIAWVTFYKDDTVVAEFIGDDYFNVVSVAGMINYTYKCYWQVSSAESYVEAHLSKDANSSSVTLDVSKAIGKKATMTSNDSDLKAATISDIKGHFHYDSLTDISKGIYVSYSNDRLVFYQDDHTGHVFTGFFVPNGRADSQTLLGIHGDKELTLSDTVWTTTT
ncbi:hypothetical protein GALMADRAFT_141343 [Galerina marginata CBS 339.88]|uniref:Uncharacterized protein n=1 Tax=Galerina marginata (strain CBS 339.88) TaxID=685588 RepID=A0A067STK5_GALM3|nr:hypothetical protein GALMADRAFT_141343 [Galerina marginata CBS 339.88]